MTSTVVESRVLHDIRYTDSQVSQDGNVQVREQHHRFYAIPGEEAYIQKQRDMLKKAFRGDENFKILDN